MSQRGQEGTGGEVIAALAERLRNVEDLLTKLFPVDEDHIGALAVSAAKIKTEAFSTFSPGLAQNGARTTSSATGRYIKFGRLVMLKIHVTCSDAGTAGNAIELTGIPAAIAPVATGRSGAHGVGTILDAGTTFVSGMAMFQTTTTIRIQADREGDWAGIAPSFALANTDEIFCTIVYESAS